MLQVLEIGQGSVEWLGYSTVCLPSFFVWNAQYLVCNKFKFCFVSYFLEIFFFLNIFEQKFVESINVKSVNIGSKIQLHIASKQLLKMCFILFYFFCILFFICGCFAYMLCLCTIVCLKLEEARRWCQIPRNGVKGRSEPACRFWKLA